MSAVAAAEGLGGAFQQQHGRAGLARGNRGAQSGVAATGDQHIVSLFAVGHVPPSDRSPVYVGLLTSARRTGVPVCKARDWALATLGPVCLILSPLLTAGEVFMA